MTSALSLTETLTSSGHSGVFSFSVDMTPAIIAAAREAQFNVWHINVSHASDAASLLDLIGRALGFPDWYGSNWDALADCLSDLSWCEADGHVLLIGGIETLLRREPSACDTFVDILRETSLLWQGDDIPFWALFESPLPDVATFPSGA